MGRHPTSSLVKDPMPTCRKASTLSRTQIEEGYENHITTAGSESTAEEEKDYGLETFPPNHKNKSVKREGLHKEPVGNWRVEGQRSANTPCFQALSPCSPSDSDSSSTFSTLGSSSSSSFLSETGSFAVEELSPASVGSTDVRSVKFSPARRSLQRTSLGSKLAGAAESEENLDDTELHSKSSLPKPAHKHLLKGAASDDPFLEYNFLEGNIIERQLFSKNRGTNSGYAGSNHPNCDKGPLEATTTEEYPSYGDNADHPHRAIEPLASASTEVFSSFSSPNRPHCADQGPLEAPNKVISEEWAHGLSTSFFVPASAGSPEACSDTSHHSSDGITLATTTDHGPKHTPSYNRESGSKQRSDYSNAPFKDDERQKQRDGLLEQCHAGSRQKSSSSSAHCMKSECHLQGHGSFELSSHVMSSTQALPHGVTECSSSPYQADIGVDTVFLKSSSVPLSTCDKSRLLRDLSLYQPLHTHGKVLSFQSPLIPKLKLDSMPSSSNHSYHEMPYKRSFVDRCTYADSVFVQGKGSLMRDLSEKRPLTMPVFDRSLSIIHPHDVIQKAANASLVMPVSKTYLRDGIPKLTKASALSYSDGKYVKADEFTPRSPLSFGEVRYTNWQGASIPDPAVLFSSKAQWDWRTKSIGARASLKSAVRNLEAAFVGSRSVSLPKTRARTVKKDAKPESARLLDRVFVSPMRSRSKHANILKSIERPPYPRDENVCSGASLRRDEKPSLPDIHSHHAMACVPIRPVIRPLPPIGHRHGKSDLEVSCKPFLPVSRSVRCLPAPKGALGLENPVSSGQKMRRLPSTVLGAASPCMLQAYLQCVVRDGLPCYTMTIEGSEEMLLARACTLENQSSKEGCKWQYTFHSGKNKTRGIGAGGWRTWIGKDSKTVSDLTGIMQVSSVLQPETVPDTGELRHLIVSEFILYDGRAEGAAHSQSLRFCSLEMPCQKRPMLGSLRGSPSSLSHASSEYVIPSSSSHLEFFDKQHSRNLTTARVSSESVNTPRKASSPHTGGGGHRPSFSLDVWSDSDLPDPEIQLLSPCPPSHMELAAMVIQVPAEDNQRESNVDDDGHTGQSSRGWGFRFLDGGSESELRSGISRTVSLSAVQAENVVKYGTIATGQASAWTNWLSAQLRFHPSISSTDHEHLQVTKDGVCIEGQRMGHSEKAENLQHGMLRSPDCVTLILPMGDHGSPGGGAKGPSSLIERWRSGGSCECGGWDLGCGLKVLSTGSSNKRIKSIPHDQQTLSIFSQGSRQELMLGLSLVKQGFFKLIFQGQQLSPLKAFATAVAILHGHQLSSPPPPSSSTEVWMKANNSKERPPRPPEGQIAAPRRSDSSSEDKAVSAFLELN